MEIASAEDNWETLPTLRNLSDFMVLDLQNVPDEDMETAILNAKYYMSQYGMRPLLSASQSRWLSDAEASLQSYQILSVRADAQG